MVKKNFAPRATSVKNGQWVTFDGLCKGCGLCITSCPFLGLEFSKENLGIYNTPSVKVNPDKCQLCRTCEHICPDSAIKVILKK